MDVMKARCVQIRWAHLHATSVRMDIHVMKINVHVSIKVFDVINVIKRSTTRCVCDRIACSMFANKV